MYTFLINPVWPEIGTRPIIGTLCYYFFMCFSTRTHIYRYLMFLLLPEQKVHFELRLKLKYYLVF